MDGLGKTTHRKDAEEIIKLLKERNPNIKNMDLIDLAEAIILLYKTFNGLL